MFKGKKIIIVVVLGVLFSVPAFALRLDFEAVRKFHDQEIEQLLKDYTLEDSLTVRAELKRKDGELKDQQVVDIPGLYQKTGEPDDRGIENVLNMYERKFVFIKKRELGEKELELVKTALTERLYLPKDTIFTTIDNTPKLDDAVKNIKTDFLFGAYTTLIKGGQFLWILIFSIGFIIALWTLAKVWKNKAATGDAGAGAGVGNGIGGSAIGDNNSKSENNIKSDDLGAEKDLNVASQNSAAFDTLNFESLCRNLNECYDALPGTTSHELWQMLPDLSTQIQFMEVIRIQDQVKDDVRNKTYSVLDQIFDFKTRAAVSVIRKKVKGISKEGLTKLSTDLALLKFIKPNDGLEKCFLAVYPSKGDHIDTLIEKSYNEHYLVLYKMFKDHFMNYISGLKDDGLLEKINSMLTFEPYVDHASDDKYKSFSAFASKLNVKEFSKKTSINTQIVHMIYSMPESELLKVEAMKSNEELKAEIPNLQWVNADDPKTIKDFFGYLSGPQIKFLMEYDPKYNDVFSKFDERTQFRFKEKMTKDANLALDWRDFRNKIKKVYSYKTAGSNDSSIKKAS